MLILEREMVSLLVICKSPELALDFSNWETSFSSVPNLEGFQKTNWIAPQPWQQAHITSHMYWNSLKLCLNKLQPQRFFFSILQLSSVIFLIKWRKWNSRVPTLTATPYHFCLIWMKWNGIQKFLVIIDVEKHATSNSSFLAVELQEKLSKGTWTWNSLYT